MAAILEEKNGERRLLDALAALEGFERVDEGAESEGADGDEVVAEGLEVGEGALVVGARDCLGVDGDQPAGVGAVTGDDGAEVHGEHLRVGEGGHLGAGAGNIVPGGEVGGGAAGPDGGVGLDRRDDADDGGRKLIGELHRWYARRARRHHGHLAFGDGLLTVVEQLVEEERVSESETSGFG